MKVGKRLTAFFLAGMLILTSNVTGFAEETTADQQPEEAKSTYLLTVDAEDSTVTVKGDHVEQKTASTYQIEVRSEVVASVVPADGKEIKEVRVNEEQMDLADGTVTFSMPEKDSLLQVILKEHPIHYQKMINAEHFKYHSRYAMPVWKQIHVNY